MRNITFFLIFIFFGFSKAVNANPSIHSKCIEAADYQGCMKYQSGIKNSYGVIPETDCTKNICSPDEVTQSTDNLGMKIIRGFYFQDDPLKRTSYYSDLDNLYRVNSEGEYGRFFHGRAVLRFYSKGIQGRTSLIGGGTTNCSTYSSSINCTTTRPTLINVPGQAPGVKQYRYDYIYDCKDKTVGAYRDNKLIKDSDNYGKKRKWHKWEDYPSTWTQHPIRIKTLEGVCNGNLESIKKQINPINVRTKLPLYPKNISNSDFYLFEEKGPKKRNYKSSKNVGNINCNSPVWKNKPRCN